MTREDPAMARKMGFKDDPRIGDGETLTLSLKVVPLWMPGQDMRGEKS